MWFFDFVSLHLCIGRDLAFGFELRLRVFLFEESFLSTRKGRGHRDASAHGISSQFDEAPAQLVVLLQYIEQLCIGLLEGSGEVVKTLLHLLGRTLFLSELFKDNGEALVVLAEAFTEGVVFLLELTVGGLGGVGGAAGEGTQGACW